MVQPTDIAFPRVTLPAWLKIVLKNYICKSTFLSAESATITFSPSGPISLVKRCVFLVNWPLKWWFRQQKNTDWRNTILEVSSWWSIELGWLMLSASPSTVRTPVGLFFLFSYAGHKFIFCRGRPQKSSPRRFLVFSRISNCGPRWPLQARHLKFTERGITHATPSSCEIGLKVEVDKRCSSLLPLHENVQNIHFASAQEKTRPLLFCDLLLTTMHFTIWWSEKL